MEDDVKKNGWGEGLREQLRRLERYKYPILVLLLGAALLLIPWGGGETPAEAAPAAGTDLMDPTALEQKLEALLGEMEGAGAVRVVLTLAKGAAYTYQTDRTTRDGEETVETVLASGSGGEGPLTREVTYPVYQGAVVACQGADSAQVRLEIVRAVASLTGLGSDKITVIKLKDK